jgi:nucleotide-binding universal stress UspA family protein
MYDDILFPTDGSEGAATVLEHALDIAAETDATLHLLNVADTARDSVTQVGGEVVDALETEGERIVDGAAERASDRGVATETAVLQGDPYRTIVDYADEYGMDLLVMPTHGRKGLERFLLGSVTERVVRRANVPVLTVRPDSDLAYPYENVLVPTDGSDCAGAALGVGIDEAAAADAALHLLSVVDTASLGVDVRAQMQIDALEANAADFVEEAETRASEAGIADVTGVVEFSSSIRAAIVEYVEDHDVDLVVVGTHGRTGVDRYLLGSVAEQLLRTVPVPVLIVREPEPADEE